MCLKRNLYPFYKHGVLFGVVLHPISMCQGFAKQDRCDGHHDCINISANKTKTIIKGKNKFIIVVSNKCMCGFNNIHVRWDNFQPAVPVDPAAILSEGSDYLIKMGNVIFQSHPFKFEYVGDEPHKGPGFSISGATRT